MGYLVVGVGGAGEEGEEKREGEGVRHRSGAADERHRPRRGEESGFGAPHLFILPLVLEVCEGVAAWRGTGEGFDETLTLIRVQTREFLQYFMMV